MWMIKKRKICFDLGKTKVIMMDKKEAFMKKNYVVLIGATVCCTLWGSAFPCIKIGYKWMNIGVHDVAAQILYAGYRFFMAGILTIVAGSLYNRRFLYPNGPSFRKIGILSMLQTVIQYTLFYIGLAHTTGVKASIIESLNTFIAIVIAGYLFHQEIVTKRKIFGCLLGFIGVILVNLGANGVNFHFAMKGEGFLALSTVAYAFSSVIMKKYSEDENPVMLSGYQFLLGGGVMIVGGILLGGHLEKFTLKAFLILLYLAFVSAAAYSLWGILLKYNSVSRVTIYGFLNPVIGVLLSTLLLGERDSLGINSMIALVLVSMGIYIVNKMSDS